MNRAQKRQAARDLKRGIMRHERVVPLPALLDEFTVFDMPQQIIDQLSNGAIDAANNTPIFRDNSGVICELVPAFEGWIFTWKKIIEKHDSELDIEPLEIVCNRLKYDMKLSPLHIELAQDVLDRCREFFRNGNRSEIASIAKTAQLQILLEPKLNQTNQ